MPHENPALMSYELFKCIFVLMLRSAVSFLLVSIIFWGAALKGVIAWIELQQHKTAMSALKQQIKKELAQEVEIPQNEFEKPGSRFVRVNSKEFTWDNNLFDIISITKSGKVYKIRCISDSNEKVLKKRLKDWTEQQNNDAKTVSKLLQLDKCDVAALTKMLLPINERAFVFGELLQRNYDSLNSSTGKPPQV